MAHRPAPGTGHGRTWDAAVPGCSPRTWHLGAETTSPVRAYEFDATTIRSMCKDDPELGASVAQWVGGVLAHRLRSARTRRGGAERSGAVRGPHGRGVRQFGQAPQ